MSGMRDDVHPPKTVASLAHVLYGLVPSLRVHPVGVAICIGESVS